MEVVTDNWAVFLECGLLLVLLLYVAYWEPKAKEAHEFFQDQRWGVNQAVFILIILSLYLG